MLTEFQPRIQCEPWSNLNANFRMRQPTHKQLRDPLLWIIYMMCLWRLGACQIHVLLAYCCCFPSPAPGPACNTHDVFQHFQSPRLFPASWTKWALLLHTGLALRVKGRALSSFRWPSMVPCHLQELSQIAAAVFGDHFFGRFIINLCDLISPEASRSEPALCVGMMLGGARADHLQELQAEGLRRVASAVASGRTQQFAWQESGIQPNTIGKAPTIRDQ